MLHILTSILLLPSLCTIFNILLLVFYLLWSKSYVLYSILYLVSIIRGPILGTYSDRWFQDFLLLINIHHIIQYCICTFYMYAMSQILNSTFYKCYIFELLYSYFRLYVLYSISYFLYSIFYGLIPICYIRYCI